MVRMGLLVSVLALSGCFTFDPGFDAGVSPIDAGEPIVLPSDPLSANGTLDSARAVKGNFGWDAGGSLTATAADGTVFTLTVPSTSLTDATAITMTPYATLNTGLGESSVGVKLEPAGLQTTTTMMVLAIRPPTGASWPLTEQVPFALQGANDVVSLAAAGDSSGAITLKLGHFSSYGLALAMKGFSASLAAVRHRLGGDLESQLETEVAAAIDQERASPSGKNLYETLLPFLNRYVEQVIKPRLAAAGQSCANARLAMQTVLGFERQMQLLGVQNQNLLAFSFQDLFKYNVVCMKEEYELCRDNHIITRILPAFLGVLRQEALLGLTDASQLNPDRYACEDYLRKCLKFTIEVTSQASYTTGTGADVYTMRESMRLPPSALATYAIDTDEAPSGLSHIDGTGALIAGELSDFTVSNYQPQYQNNCLTVSNVTPMGGQFGMASLGFRPKTAPDGSPGDLATRAQVGDFFLVPAINPNLSQHVISERDRDSNGVCSGTPRVSTVIDSWSTRGFAPWLSSIATTSADSYISDWTIVGGEVMATKNVPQWSNAAGESFSGTFTLHHAPDPN